MKAQKITSFVGGYVQPNSESNLRLSEGVYSISSRCNLPYVEFLASGGYQKVISWGEFAEIPCDMTVTVKNASAHPGNLIINAGIEAFPLPSRITAPARILSTGVEFGAASTEFSFDTRRCKRAYLIVDGMGPVNITVAGRARGSLDTANLITSGEKGVGYIQTHAVGALSQIPPIPLGFRSVMGDDSRPMALLDYCQVAFDVPFEDEPAAYYVAEYL